MNFQSRREVIFTCYIYMREIGILFVQCSWEKSAELLLATVEDVMSSANPGSFARTFRDGDKVFIMQLGANAYGNFVMISELVHGRRKGFIMVPEGKLGSGWRGFGFHLRKAIAPETLAAKPPS